MRSESAEQRRVLTSQDVKTSPGGFSPTRQILFCTGVNRMEKFTHITNPPGQKTYWKWQQPQCWSNNIDVNSSLRTHGPQRGSEHRKRYCPLFISSSLSDGRWTALWIASAVTSCHTLWNRLWTWKKRITDWGLALQKCSKTAKSSQRELDSFSESSVDEI